MVEVNLRGRCMHEGISAFIKAKCPYYDHPLMPISASPEFRN